MAIADARTAGYVAIFKGQHGGAMLPVFQGLDRYQSGQGLGDIFRGILRRVIPVALSVGKAALAAFTGAHEQGSSIKEALKATIRPATTAALSGTLEQIQKAQSEKAESEKAQKGAGRRKRKRVYKSKKRYSKQIGYNF